MQICLRIIFSIIIVERVIKMRHKNKLTFVSFI